MDAKTVCVETSVSRAPVGLRFPKQIPFGANGREEEGVGVDVPVLEDDGEIDKVEEGDGEDVLDGVDVCVTFSSSLLPTLVDEFINSEVVFVITSITAHVNPPPSETDIKDNGVIDILLVSVVIPLPPPPLAENDLFRVALTKRGRLTISGINAIDEEFRLEKLLRSPQQNILPFVDIAHV